ncbi:MAG: DUF4143 domain-containing protein [Deltaproteobacteria bacterium]|nr:DUF4143 domain-containing protein [Deltaproteobacteria bacterium]
MSLRKQPKVYLWDWSTVNDPGARRENLIASHLLKAVQLWTDIGLGDYGLYFVRDKARREVDFLVTKDGQPWILAEVKSGSGRGLNPNLEGFHDLLGAEHAFQLVFDLEHAVEDVFALRRPVRVPATSFLSQLV